MTPRKQNGGPGQEAHRTAPAVECARPRAQQAANGEQATSILSRIERRDVAATEDGRTPGRECARPRAQQAANGEQDRPRAQQAANGEQATSILSRFDRRDVAATE